MSYADKPRQNLPTTRVVGRRSVDGSDERVGDKVRHVMGIADSAGQITHNIVIEGEIEALQRSSVGSDPAYRRWIE